MAKKAKKTNSLKKTPLELQELLVTQELISDRVEAVARGAANGFYMFGRAGTAKTYTIRHTLDDFGKPYEYVSGHITPMGLFDLLREHAKKTIVLDDVSELLKSKVGLQILMAALGTQPNDTGERVVRYCRQGSEETIHFRGGIIMISNLELHSTPLLQALRSRVHYLKYDPSDEQIAALMRHVATKGWTKTNCRMSPTECLEVAEFVIAESERLSVRLDMRLLVDKAYPDFVARRNGHTRTSWKDLVTATLRTEHVAQEQEEQEAPLGREEKKQADLAILREVVGQYSTVKERVAAWQELTGKNARTYYRLLPKLDA